MQILVTVYPVTELAQLSGIISVLWNELSRVVLALIAIDNDILMMKWMKVN